MSNPVLDPNFGFAFECSFCYDFVLIVIVIGFAATVFLALDVVVVVVAVVFIRWFLFLRMFSFCITTFEQSLDYCPSAISICVCVDAFDGWRQITSTCHLPDVFFPAKKINMTGAHC